MFNANAALCTFIRKRYVAVSTAHDDPHPRRGWIKGTGEQLGTRQLAP